MTSSWNRTLIFIFLLTVVSHVRTQITVRPTNDLDLIFLVDGSSSVGEDRFRLILQAVLNFIEELPVGTNAVNVGLVSFSTTLDVITLTGNMTTLRAQISNLEYEGRGTNTNAAFWEARTMMMSSFRANAPKTVILVTDGISRFPEESRRAAEALRAEGVDVWAVGIGNNIRLLELRDFTGDIQKVITTDRYDVLPDMDLGVPRRDAPNTTANPQPTVSPSATASVRVDTTTMIQPTANTRSIPVGTVSNPTSTGATPAVSRTSAIIDPSATQPPSTQSQPTVSPSATASVRVDTTMIQPTATTRSVSVGTVSNPTSTEATPTVSRTSAIIDPSATQPPSTPSQATPVIESTLSPSGAGTQTIHSTATPSSSMPGYVDVSTIRPTATQTLPDMSSTMVGGRDGDDEDDNDFQNMGDNSVSFNASGNAGLCSKAVAMRGFGFAPHPHSCDKFIQCHLSDQGRITASVRLCPRGLYWDRRNLTCVDPQKTSCAKDPCSSLHEGFTFKMDGGCGLYWECKEGVATGKNCLPNHAYVAGKGCVFNADCPYQDIEPSVCENDGKCGSWPGESNTGYKFQVTGGWYVSQCLYRNVFDLASCSCRPRKDSDDKCHLTTRSEREVDVNGTLGRHKNEPCDMQPVEESNPLRPLNIHFRYRSSTNQTTPPGHEVLLRSKKCLQGGLFVVSDDAESLRVRIVSRKGHVLSEALPLLGLNRTEWRDVRIQYFGGELTIEVSVGELTYTTYLRGGEHIPAGLCGWSIGSPGQLKDHVQEFTGDIETVTASRCTSYGV